MKRLAVFALCVLGAPVLLASPSLAQQKFVTIGTAV